MESPVFQNVGGARPARRYQGTFDAKPQGDLRQPGTDPSVGDERWVRQIAIVRQGRNVAPISSVPNCVIEGRVDIRGHQLLIVDLQHGLPGQR